MRAEEVSARREGPEFETAGAIGDNNGGGRAESGDEGARNRSAAFVLNDAEDRAGGQ